MIGHIQPIQPNNDKVDNIQLTQTNGDHHLWRNVGAEPLISYSFMLRVEGMWDLPCKRITNMRRENEFDYIQEGGLNDYVHMKRKPISKPFTFQVERYVGVDLAIGSDPLAMGTELVLPLILFVNKYALWDAKDMKPVRTYAFTGCTVIGKDYGELNAEQSGLLLETTTISYREMACFDIYSDLLSSDTWSFDGTKKEGKGKRRYNMATSNSQEPTKDELQERARKWSFAQAPNAEQFVQMARRGESLGALYKKGGGVRSAAYNSDEKTKEKLLENANKWSFDGTKKEGKGTQSAKKHDPEEKTKEELFGKARKWSLDENTKEGSGTQSAKYNPDEETKDELKGKAAEWSFDGTNKDGSGTQSAKYNPDEATEESLQEKAKQWSFDGTEKEGNGMQSAKYNPDEETKDELKGKAAEWSFDGTNKDGSGTQSAKYNPNEETKDELKGKAAEWSFDGTNKEGSGTQSATYNPDEATKGQFEEKANLWPDTESVKKPENKVPEPRLWPKKKSAQSITQYLSDYAKKGTRK